MEITYVARQDVERYIEGFINEYTPREELEFINLELDGLKHIPSVTPIRPKGHWREVDVNMYACSKCSHVLTINPFDNSISEMNTCPFCSADMREAEE